MLRLLDFLLCMISQNQRFKFSEPRQDRTNLTEIPVFDLVQILSFGSIMLGDNFQSVVEMVFVH